MVLDKMMENGGSKKGLAVSKAMLEVGFSPAYSKNPQKFTRTKTFKELMDEYLPDELIAEKHNELLNAAEIQHYLFPKIEEKIYTSKKGKAKISRSTLTNAEIREIVQSVPGCRLIYVKRDSIGAWAYFQSPDSKSRKDAVDMAYKLRGNYSPDKIELTKRKYQHLSDEELMAHKKALIDFLKKR